MAMFSLITVLTGFIAVGCNPVTVPQSTKLIDLTHTFDEDTTYHPLLIPFEMKVYNGSFHGVWYQAEEIYTNTHTGTHVDAPCHFVPGRWAVNEIPIDHLMPLPAAVVDISQKAQEDPDYVLQVTDLEQWEESHGQIPNGAVLVMNTGYGAFFNDSDRYLGMTGNRNNTGVHYPGLAPGAARWLVDNREIYGVATDAVSIESPQMKNESAHIILEDRNIYSIESVGNLDMLPPSGATLFVLPMKLGKACGAPCRVVASVTFAPTSAGGGETPHEDNRSSEVAVP